MDYDLREQVILITGGSRGIGLETAKLALEQGAHVVICGRKQNGLEKAAEILGAGDRLMSIPAHVAKETDVDNLFDQIDKKFGRLDVLIHNVGMNIITSAVDADFSLWQKIIDTNLNGAYLCARKAARTMRDNKKGKIVNISSIAGRRAAPVMGVYGIAKAAIEMMTKVLAQELGPHNVNVNAVAPCMVRTDFSKPFWGNEDLCKQITRTIPLGRIAESVDVAHAALFLSSKGADFITGQTIMVDGGASAV
jgi:NAD(P)-dependent dehydrogenase (short-subunit alcohol dehydrogenase family)